MGELREYRYLLNGHETTGVLSDADAERLAAVPVDEPEPEPKARPVQAAARPAAGDKARTAEDKRR